MVRLTGKWKELDDALSKAKINQSDLAKALRSFSSSSDDYLRVWISALPAASWMFWESHLRAVLGNLPSDAKEQARRILDVIGRMD